MGLLSPTGLAVAAGPEGLVARLHHRCIALAPVFQVRVLRDAAFAGWNRPDVGAAQNQDLAIACVRGYVAGVAGSGGRGGRGGGTGGAPAVGLRAVAGATGVARKPVCARPRGGTCHEKDSMRELRIADDGGYWPLQVRDRMKTQR